MKNTSAIIVVLHFFIFSLSAQTEAQLNISALSSLSIEELLNIEITTVSKKQELSKEAPGIVSAMSNEEILSYPNDNLGKLLNILPSTFFLTSNVFTDNVLSVRGQTITPYNNHLLFLFNGRPIRDPISGGLNSALLTALPVNALSSIELIRGPGSVLYGSGAYSGTINLKSQNNLNSNNFTGQIGIGSYNQLSQSAIAKYVFNDLFMTLGIKHISSDGPLYNFTDAENNLSEAYFSRETLSFLASLEYNKFTFDFVFAKFEPYALDGGALTWNHENSGNNNNHTTLFADIGYKFEFTGSNYSQNNFTINNHEWIRGGGKTMNALELLFENTNHISLINEKLEFITGLTFTQAIYHGENLFDDKNFSISTYSQFDYRFNETLKFIGGIQYNKIESIPGNISPRAGLIITFNESWWMKLLYSNAFRKAYPLETSFDHPLFRGNLKLEPEEIDTHEAQLGYSSKKYEVSLTYYNSNMTNLISRMWYDDPSIPDYEGYLKYINTGSYRFWGIEFENKFYLLENLFTTSSLLYQKNQNSADVENANLFPNLLIKLSLLYSYNNLKISVFNLYSSSPKSVTTVNPNVQISNSEPSAINILNMKVSYDFSNIPVFNYLFAAVEVENILNNTITYPEYTSKNINSLIPLSKGRTFNFNIGVKL